MLRAFKNEPEPTQQQNENTAVSRISSWRFDQGDTTTLVFRRSAPGVLQFCFCAAVPCPCAASWSLSMANSRFQYVKKFELPDALLPDTYLVTRLDGHRFTNFTAQHGFTKPNDERGLLLMAEVSTTCMSVCLPTICTCLPVWLYVWLSVCLALWLSGCLSGCLSVLWTLDCPDVHAKLVVDRSSTI